MVLRSDESANQAEVQRDESFRSNIGKGVAAASSLAGVGMGAGIASKVMPFLNKYIPVDLAIKGISKVNPRIGDFLKKGQKMGLDIQEGMNFIKSKLEERAKPEEGKNIIQQYSPELHDSILSHIKSGRNPFQAGAIVSKDKKFSDVIKKITKDHKVPWADILSQIYGEPEKKKGLMDQEKERFEGAYPEQMYQRPMSQQELEDDIMSPPHSTPSRPPSAESQAFTRPQGAQQQPQQGQGGQGQKALMDILNKINEKLGK